MTLKFWLIIAGVIILVVGISTLVAYYKGKRVGAAQAKPQVVQYDVKAADEVRKKVAEAEAQLAEVKKKTEEHLAELERVLAIQDEKARLKALADLANRCQ